MVALGTLASISPSVTFVALVVSTELGMAASTTWQRHHGDHQACLGWNRGLGIWKAATSGESPREEGEDKTEPTVICALE